MQPKNPFKSAGLTVITLFIQLIWKNLITFIFNMNLHNCRWRRASKLSLFTSSRNILTPFRWRAMLVFMYYYKLVFIPVNITCKRILNIMYAEPGIVPGIAYVYGPICFSSIANIVFFASTAITLRRTNKDSALAAASKTSANKQKYTILHYLSFGIYTD